MTIRPTAARRPSLIGVAALSALLHAGAVWLLLPHRPGRADGDPPPTIEVEMVQQAAEVKGAAVAPATPPPPAPATPRLQAPQGTEPQAPPPAPARPAPPGPPPSTSNVNLGDAEQDQDSLSVTGRNILPARPDSRFRNKPPGYPSDAVRRHAQGTVGLRVHVTERGTAAWVDVIETSGDATLDRTAREALALWRFQPAHAGPNAVPFDFDIAIRFNLDDATGDNRLDDPP